MYRLIRIRAAVERHVSAEPENRGDEHEMPHAKIPPPRGRHSRCSISRVLHVSGTSCRLDMNQDVGNPGQFASQRRANVSSNGVGCGDGERWVDLDVQVDVVLQAGFSREHLVYAQHPGNGYRDLQNLARQLRRRHGVRELERCIAHHNGCRS